MDVNQLLDLRTITSAMLVGGAGYILRWASKVNVELGVLHERANGHEKRLDDVERRVYNGD